MPKITKKEQAIILFQQGMNKSQIARELGVYASTVARWLDPKLREKQAEYFKKWYEKNKERSNLRCRKRYYENRETILAKHRDKIKGDPEYRERVNLNSRKYSRKWRLKNKDKRKIILQRWNRQNPDRRNMLQAKRRARQLSATPPWLTEDHLASIADVYSEAKRLSELHGCPYHVDHIMPLVGKDYVDGRLIQISCGLHVAWNLRAIPQKENITKNCFLPSKEEWLAC
jgi:transposase-like protein